MDKILLPEATSFYRHEFQCSHCGALRIHPGFIGSLQSVRDRVRARTGIGMAISSGCRCSVHNAAVGGAPESFHVCDVDLRKGQQGSVAADVVTPDGFYRGVLFEEAWRAGFSIGWNAKRRFLHLDRRDFFGLKQTSFDY